jgi:tetratricopeptide (TPR) repeat protein
MLFDLVLLTWIHPISGGRREIGRRCCLKHPNRKGYGMKEFRRAGRKGFAVLALFACLESACTMAQGGGETLPSLEREAHKAMGQGDLKKARDLDLRALSLAPDDVELLNNLAVVEDRLGEEDKALRTLKRASSQSPGDARILLNLARIELKLGREGEAFRTAGKIVSMDRWPDGFRTLMGKIDIDLARYEEAHVYLHEALERHPGNPLVHTYLGIVHFRLGERADAEKNFRDALSHHPSPKLRRSLLMLLSDPEKVLGPSQPRSIPRKEISHGGQEGKP